MDGKAAGGPLELNLLNLTKCAVLICWCQSKIFEFCHTSEALDKLPLSRDLDTRGNVVAVGKKNGAG